MTAGAGSALDRIGELLADLGYPSQRLDGHPDLALPTLLVAAPDDGEGTGEPTLFNLMFMPVEGTGLDQVDLLQVYFPLLEDVGESRRGDVALLVAELNAQLPLGQLGLLDGEVSLRHMMLLERGHVPSRGVLEEGLGFLVSLRNFLAEAVAGVAEGRTTLEAALASLP